jgi:prepilin-type N-terminal cleavage/methylation domain-containing protein
MIPSCRHIFKSFKSVSPRADFQAFSLVELLSALVISGILFAAVGNLLINHMLSVRQIERGQRFREDANRLNYLLAIEAGEASEFIFGAALSGCNDSGSSLIAMSVPRPTGAYADDANASTIYYYNIGGNLMRCGPPVNRNGVLDHGGAPVVGVVARRTQMEVITEGGVCVRVSDNRTIVYNLDFADSAGGAYSRCQIARAKTVFVCNPPVGSGGAVGDCPP